MNYFLCPKCCVWVDDIHACNPETVELLPAPVPPEGLVDEPGIAGWVTYNTLYTIAQSSPATTVNIHGIHDPVELFKEVTKIEHYGYDDKIVRKTTFSDGTIEFETMSWNAGEFGFEKYGEKSKPADRPPRARRAFPDDMSRQDWWAYVVERRTKSSLLEKEWWGDWKTAPEEFWPVGFSTRAAALRRQVACMRLDYGVGGGTSEFRVVPKYLGYRPDKEKWYSSDQSSEPPDSIA